MVKKIVYGLSALGTYLASVSFANAASCEVNGQPVDCPAWLGTVGPVAIIVWLAVIILMIASMWKIFQKAGRPGWAAIIPVYNLVVLFQIVGLSPWWLLLLVGSMIPLLGVLAAIALTVVTIIAYVRLAKAFGKGTGFALGLIFLNIIFLPILAFGDAKFMGPQPANSTVPPQQPPMTPPPAQPTQM